MVPIFLPSYVNIRLKGTFMSLSYPGYNLRDYVWPQRQEADTSDLPFKREHQ